MNIGVPCSARIAYARASSCPTSGCGEVLASSQIQQTSGVAAGNKASLVIAEAGLFQTSAEILLGKRGKDWPIRPRDNAVGSEEARQRRDNRRVMAHRVEI